MRGKALMEKRENLENRITPAYAGKSMENHINMNMTKDHPCVCGEKNVKIDIDGVVMGSPLRMRGKAHMGTPLMFRQRITPAYAGKRPKPISAKYGQWITPAYAGKSCKIGLSIMK